MKKFLILFSSLNVFLSVITFIITFYYIKWVYYLNVPLFIILQLSVAVISIAVLIFGIRNDDSSKKFCKNCGSKL